MDHFNKYNKEYEDSSQPSIVLTMHLTETTKGQPRLHENGSCYNVHYRKKNGDIVWRCAEMKKGCRATVYTTSSQNMEKFVIIRSEGEHVHDALRKHDSTQEPKRGCDEYKDEEDEDEEDEYEDVEDEDEEDEDEEDEDAKDEDEEDEDRGLQNSLQGSKDNGTKRKAQLDRRDRFGKVLRGNDARKIVPSWLRKYVPHLRLLYNASPSKRRTLLKTVPDGTIHAICQLSHDVLLKKLPLSPAHRRRLKPYKRHILALLKKAKSIKQRRQQLVQQGRGFCRALVSNFRFLRNIGEY